MIITSTVAGGTSAIPGYTVGSSRIADFSVYTPTQALVTLAVADGIEGILQGGDAFENPLTFGSVWGFDTYVPLQWTGIMTHLWVVDQGLAKIVKVIDASTVVVEDPTGGFGALGLGQTIHALKATYKAPFRLTMSSATAWWIGGEGELYAGVYGQPGGFTYVFETGRPYMVFAQTDVTVVAEY